MKIKDITRILRRSWLWLLILPIITGAIIYYFTLDMPEEYTSDMVIYSGIASGININVGGSTNQLSAHKAYSNLLSLFNSRDTKKEVALRLLTDHLMLKEHDASLLSFSSYQRLHELIDEPLRQKLVGKTKEETYLNLNAYYQSSSSNEIYKLLHSMEPGYSFEALSKLKALHLSNSDLVQVEYTSHDPAICRHTLELLSGTFIGKHKELMEGQNESVLDYYKSSTTQAYERLESAEQRLLEFHKANKIINYNDQASTIAGEKQALAQQYNDLEMQYSGAYASLKAVEEKLKDRGASTIVSQDIMLLKRQLASLNTQIAEQEVYNRGLQSTKLTQLKKESAETAAALEASMTQYHLKNQSVDGIAPQSLLDDWIKNTIYVEEIKGKLLTIGRQRDRFGKEYDKMAPLGAELRKIERELDLAKDEYFALITGLNQSQVNKQNIELTSNLKVIDKPFLPTKPKGSNQMIMVIFGAFATLMLTSSVLVGTELLDSRLKNTDITIRKTGLPVLGALPLLDSKNKQDQVKLKWVQDHLSRQVLLRMQQKKETPGPYVIGVVSSLGSEGKSTFVSILAHKLNSLGIKTLSMFPENHANYISAGTNVNFYSPLQGINQNVSVDALAERQVTDYNVVIVEFPPLLEATYPVSLFKQLDLGLYTISAARSWQEADKKTLKLVQEITTAPIEVFLNGIQPEESEDINGVQLSTLSIKKHKKLQASKKEEVKTAKVAGSLKPTV